MNEKLKVLLEWINIEFLMIPSILLLLSWGFYKIFLKGLSLERHRNLRKNYYTNIAQHFMVFLVLFSVFWLLSQINLINGLHYLALMVFIWGWIVIIKTARVALLQSLFLTSMRSGVPILLVNIFSLILSLGLSLWTINNVFQIDIAPLLATSAAFSIILGLALQDTLGNLFAGVALQLDRSFEIGDWLEIGTGPGKIVGQVQEITWRATTMIGLFDEIITMPNRTMASSQISNYSPDQKPIIRTCAFYLPLKYPSDEVKSVLLKSLESIKEIQRLRKPVILITDSSDSWLLYKIVFFLDNYGAQLFMVDRVYTACSQTLKDKGFDLAGQTLQINSNKT